MPFLGLIRGLARWVPLSWRVSASISHVLEGDLACLQVGGCLTCHFEGALLFAQRPMGAVGNKQQALARRFLGFFALPQWPWPGSALLWHSLTWHPLGIPR